MTISAMTLLRLPARTRRRLRLIGAAGLLVGALACVDDHLHDRLEGPVPTGDGPAATTDGGGGGDAGAAGDGAVQNDAPACVPGEETTCDDAGAPDGAASDGGASDGGAGDGGAGDGGADDGGAGDGGAGDGGADD